MQFSLMKALGLSLALLCGLANAQTPTSFDINHNTVAPSNSFNENFNLRNYGFGTTNFLDFIGTNSVPDDFFIQVDSGPGSGEFDFEVVLDYTDFRIDLFEGGTVTGSLVDIGIPITDVFVSAPDGSEFGNFSTDGLSIFFNYTVADVLAINEGQVTISFSLRQTFVVPADFANEEGNGSGEGTALGRFSNTAQIVYDASLLSAAGLQAGDVLTGLSFRVGASALGGGAPLWSVDDYQIRLATSLNSAGSLNPDFTLNRGADFVTVRSGPLMYDGTEYDLSLIHI